MSIRTTLLSASCSQETEPGALVACLQRLRSIPPSNDSIAGAEKWQRRRAEWQRHLARHNITGGKKAKAHHRSKTGAGARRNHSLLATVQIAPQLELPAEISFTNISVTPDARELLLGLGVVSAPKLRVRRDWLRAAALRFDRLDSISTRFVLGAGAGGTPQHKLGVRAVLQEAAELGDVMLLLSHRDGHDQACVQKSFAWWFVALRIFPNARFLAKTDDDSLNNHGNLADLLRLLPVPRHADHLAYGGWPQYASFLPEYNRGCGYAMLCHAMLCYTVLCSALLCCAMLCHAMLCHAMI
jgi:hypothetical protein